MRRTWRSCCAVRLLRLTLATALAAGSGGCGPWPRDVRSSTDEILRQGVLYAGFAPNPPWTGRQSGAPSGVEVELVTAFARDLGVRTDWTEMTESALADALANGQIYIAVAGFHADSPVGHAVRFTRPYVSYEGRRHVMAVPHGESRLLVALERFLHGRGDAVLRAIERGRVVAE